MRIGTVLIVALLIIACQKQPEQGGVQETTVDIKDEPYKGFQQDRADLRDTYLIEKQNINASSGKAGAAAHRIFRRITFLGKSKKEVLGTRGHRCNHRPADPGTPPLGCSRTPEPRRSWHW